MGKRRTVEKAVENVDNPEFLTVSTGFSTGDKNGKKLGRFCGSLHNFLFWKFKKPHFLTHNHFDNREKSGVKNNTWQPFLFAVLGLGHRYDL